MQTKRFNNSNIRDYWSQITTTNNNNETAWNIARTTKLQLRDMKWANAVKKLLQRFVWHRLVTDV